MLNKNILFSPDFKSTSWRIILSTLLLAGLSVACNAVSANNDTQPAATAGDDYVNDEFRACIEKLVDLKCDSADEPIAGLQVEVMKPPYSPSSMANVTEQTGPDGSIVIPRLKTDSLVPSYFFPKEITFTGEDGEAVTACFAQTAFLLDGTGAVITSKIFTEGFCPLPPGQNT